MQKKYIITGGPGTGKTSIINELKKRGFVCVNESARGIINHEIKYGGQNLPWKNQISFENQLSDIRTKKYFSVTKNQLCFFDRSSIDCMAYLHLNNLKTTSKIINNIKKCPFNKNVFYTPFWKEIYKNDHERKETIKEAQEIEKAIIKTYKLQGYKLIPVPKKSIKERTDFIISEICNF